MALTLKDRSDRQASGNAAAGFDPSDRDEAKLVSIPLRLIDPDPNQPRKNIGKFADLAVSIRTHGLLQPLIVEAVNDGRYRILVGERRFVACRTLGLKTAPCIVRTVTEQSRLTLQLIENLHRKALHPVEVAQAYRRLMDEFNLDQAALAKRMGIARSSINESLRILDLNPEVLAAVRTSEHVTKSILIEIAKEQDPQQQGTLLQQAQAGQTSVRQARAAKQMAKGEKPRTRAVTIVTDDATVIVQFTQGEAVKHRVKAALERALAQQR